MSSFILKYVAVDKLLHFLMSYALTLTLIALTKELFISSFVVFAIGAGKEVHDSYQPGNLFSVADMIANFIGIISAVVIGLLI